MAVYTSLREMAGKVIARLQSMKNADYVFGGAALTLLALMKKRIFDEGKAADGSDIGTYSAAYLEIRQRPPNKGGLGRGGDPKVIFTATAQMRNDFSYIVGTPTSVGLGFKNKFNYDKARKNEKQFKKDVFSMTASEREITDKIINTRIKDILAGIS